MSAPQPRRVLMTVDAVGGVWRYAMDLGRALSERGIGVVYACLGPQPSDGQRREAQAVGELVELDLPLDWTVQSAAELAGVPDGLAELAGRAGVDLLHLNVPSQAAGLVTDLPVVAAAHSCVVTWFRAVRGSGVPAGWEWQYELNQAGLAAADLVLAPSRSFAIQLEAAYGELPQLQVVYNAVRPIPAVEPKQPIVLAAGRWWDDGKNAATLDAAATRCEWPVQMAGAVRGPNGQHRNLLHATVLGEVPNADLRERIAAAGIFCSPSLYEPFGLAPLEAASAGAALVLADIPTYRELWDGAALFAPATDANGFAESINRLAEDAELRRQLGRDAAARASAFTLSAQVDGVLRAYADATALHRTQRRLSA